MISVYCDGSSHAHSGAPTGSAAVLIYKSKVVKKKVYKVLMEAELSGSNNTAELLAATIALEHYKKKKKLRVYSDSEYVVKGMNTWSKKWVKNKWKDVAGKPVKNKKYWKRLLKAAEMHDVEFVHVKGHAGNYWNEMADNFAVRAKTYQISGSTNPLPVDEDIRL